ncbi:hypothetical protein B0H17DRAFT_1137960 [Mycena rosella]|uniref:Uncharacterized protein n=1 Tax=Mycena rosella TaxID=1033263 RepID=A0AAD7D7C7_MYCRO|nr:hypothetical protein B0H17DRAFT_1137960 [Mycena rosella]
MQLLRQIAVTYDDRGPNKGLPKCGTLFASRPEALAGHWQQWVVVNLVLFLLPGMTTCLILLHSSFIVPSLHRSPIPSPSPGIWSSSLVSLVLVCCYIIPPVLSIPPGPGLDSKSAAASLALVIYVPTSDEQLVWKAVVHNIHYWVEPAITMSRYRQYSPIHDLSACCDVNEISDSRIVAALDTLINHSSVIRNGFDFWHSPILYEFGFPGNPQKSGAAMNVEIERCFPNRHGQAPAQESYHDDGEIKSLGPREMMSRLDLRVAILYFILASPRCDNWVYFIVFAIDPFVCRRQSLIFNFEFRDPVIGSNFHYTEVDASISTQPYHMLHIRFPSSHQNPTKSSPITCD